MVNTGTVVVTDNQDQSRLFTVSGLVGASGTSPPIALGPGNNLSIAIEGTFSAATFILNGSNDGGVTWFALKDWQNVAVSLTANGIQFVSVYPLLVQVAWSGGGGGTTCTAYIGLFKTFF